MLRLRVALSAIGLISVSACSGSEFSQGAGGSSGAGGSAGAAGGSSGAAAGGAAGSAIGGSAGSASGGSAGSFPGGNGGDAGQQSGGAAGNGGAAGSGAAGSGGAAGDGGVAGNGGAAGSGGSMSACPGGCPAHAYCNEKSGSCDVCSDTTRLVFGDPVPLAAAATDSDERFPRETDGGDVLVFRRDADIVTLAAPFSGAANLRWAGASGPSPRAFSTTELQFSEAFDKSISTGRAVFGVIGGVVSQLPFNQFVTVGDGALDFSPTSSNDRVFFMSNRPLEMNGKRTNQLFTHQPGFAGATTHTALTLDNGCEATGEDFAPWVTRNGALLLFMSSETTAANQCVPEPGARRDLYWTSLAAGQQVGKASPLNVSLPGVDDVEPSLSADLCTLYFARSDPSEPSGKHRIHSARRR